MLKNISLFLVLSFTVLSLSAQEFVLLSYGPSYSNQVFYTLDDDNKLKVFNGDWHIMLTSMGLQDAGVHLNESSNLSGENIDVFVAPSNDFSKKIDAEDLTIQLFNPDSSWTVGAFNSLRDPSNPFDYGWGTYDPAQLKVVGNEVFAIKFRNGTYKKVQVTSLDLTTYKFKWADLDGGNEESMEVNKQQYADNELLMVDLIDKKVIASPPAFDLMFTRYNSPLDDGQGGFLNYVVTGVLSGPNVTVAEADDIDPATVSFEDYKDQLDPRLDIIGQDWKAFNLNALKWIIDDNRVFFVKDTKGVIWKITFVDFEGSSTGNVAFNKEEVGSVASIDHLSQIDSWIVYPNPVGSGITVLIESLTQQEAIFEVVNISGQIVDQWSKSLNATLVTSQHDLSHLSAGQYILVLSTNEGQVSQSFIKE